MGPDRSASGKKMFADEKYNFGNCFWKLVGIGLTKDQWIVGSTYDPGCNALRAALHVEQILIAHETDYKHM